MADGNGSITTGGTAQAALSASSGRRGFWIQNTSTGELRVSRDATASATVGLRLSPGDLYESPVGMPVSGAISVWGATTGQTYSAGDY